MVVSIFGFKSLFPLRSAALVHPLDVAFAIVTVLWCCHNARHGDVLVVMVVFFALKQIYIADRSVLNVTDPQRSSR